MRTVDAQVPVLFLLVLADVDLMRFVVQTQLLERDAHFLPIRRAGRVEDDVLCSEDCQRHGFCWSGTMDTLY